MIVSSKYLLTLLQFNLFRHNGHIGDSPSLVFPVVGWVVGYFCRSVSKIIIGVWRLVTGDQCIVLLGD
jgi:hypothetical protein